MTPSPIPTAPHMAPDLYPAVCEPLEEVGAARPADASAALAFALSRLAQNESCDDPRPWVMATTPPWLRERGWPFARGLAGMGAAPRAADLDPRGQGDRGPVGAGGGAEVRRGGGGPGHRRAAGLRHDPPAGFRRAGGRGAGAGAQGRPGAGPERGQDALADRDGGVGARAVRRDRAGSAAPGRRTGAPAQRTAWTLAIGAGR